MCAGVVFLGWWGAPRAYGLDPHVPATDYIAKRWDTSARLPHNSVRSLVQTQNGYLWVGTRYGLARFDGLSFITFGQKHVPAFSSDYITALAETRDGSLWIGTAAGLVRYHNGRFTGYGKADGLKMLTINALCALPDGSLWIGGREGITRWVDGAFRNDIDTGNLDLLGMRSICIDSQQDVWIAITSHALRYRDGAFTTFGRADGITSERVERVVEDQAGRILVATQDGLLRFEGGRFVPFAHDDELLSKQINATLVDRDGNLWIGSVGGLDRVQDGEVAPYLDGNGVGFGIVDTLFEDREGCVWVGTSSGLYRLTDRRARTWKIDAELSSNVVTSMAEMDDGSQWFATWGSGLVRIDEGKTTHLTKGSPLSHETVTVIYEAPDGIVWLGNRGSSLDRWDGDTVTTYVYASGVPSSRPVTALLTDDDGSLLLGIANRGLLTLRDGEIVPVPEAAALAKTTVWTLHRDQKGTLLMGTSDGFRQRRTDGTWEAVDLPGLKPPIYVRAILEEPDGAMWLATEGQGLVRWAGGKARSYGTDQGMLDDALLSVVDDRLGSLWVNSVRGIARYPRSQFAELDRGGIGTLTGMTLGPADGLMSASAPDSGNPSGYRLIDGRLLFATDQGVAVIDPRSVATNALPPPVVIESYAADDQRHEVNGRVSLPAGTSKLEIRFTALSLIAPERLHFRYQLQGSDPRWVEAGTDRSAHYTHLSPGEYTFRVVACNNDGVWSETETSVAIALAPFFYQTWWFRGAVGLAIIGAIAFLIRLRLRQLYRRESELKRMNNELDRRVRERTAELSASHEELQQREQLFRLIFEHAPLGISWMRADLGANCHFNSTYRRILDWPADTPFEESPLARSVHPDDASRYAAMTERIQSGQEDSFVLEQRFLRPDGAVVWGMLSVAVVRDAQGQIVQEIGIMEDISARKAAEAELAEGNRNMIDLSRQAGMAEVATGVLHNVGNVLNSINVSATLVGEAAQKLEVSRLVRVCELLERHHADLGAFFKNDPKAGQIPRFLGALAGHLGSAQRSMLKEIQDLHKNIGHIKDIVAMQQSYAKVSGVAEEVPVLELVEDALRMNAEALARHDVTLVREFHTQQLVEVEKHKVLQILVNLIQNAKYACDDSGRADKRLVVRIEDDGERVEIAVSDNGVGIPPENLTRIFSHGFTTRKDGHGFGLHSGALAAKELGGALRVFSDGAGQGATFVLELPVGKVAKAA